MRFKSHPDKYLIDHIKEVTEKSLVYMGEVDENIKNALKITSKTHDFGKYTTYFQERLHDSDKNPLADHSFISALFGAYIGQNILGKDSILSLIIYNAILHHHGNLTDIDKHMPRSTRDMSNLKINLDIVDRQIDNMEQHKEIISTDLQEIDISIYFEKFIDERPYEKILKNLRTIKHKMDMEMIDTTKIFYMHQLIYSALIDADKMSASNTLEGTIKNISYEELVDIYINRYTSTDGLSLLRREVFDNIQKNMNENIDQKIFSITAPTGTGKTLAGFYAAKKLSQYLGNRRIIYALPFTSIIDQNYEVIKELYLHDEDFINNISRYIIKHHNLSDIEYKNEDIDYDVDQSKLMIEGWNSFIIITTFVQLFESLLGVRNKMLKKYHSIKGAVIILDELQTIPIEYWNLIDDLLVKVCEELDCRVITMTATKPIILKDSVELLNKYEKYFKKLNRVKLYYDNESISVDRFCDDFLDNLEDKSYLIVCNTIGQSLDIYDKLTGIDRKVMYLSTNIIPKERQQRIQTIRDKIKENPIVISTQVIEAGVDLDFDVVIRDLAPIDSIIQSAGRCNRNNEETGIVKVTKMVKEDGSLYGRYVYGNMLLRIASDLLEDKTLQESDFLDLIEKYFLEAYKMKNTEDKSEELIEAIQKLDFEIIKSFSIIKNRPNYIDVYFETDNEAVDLYERYKEIRQMKKGKKKYAELLKIYRKISQYIISIPDRYLKEFDIDQSKFIRMPIEDKDRLYRDDIGFTREDIKEAIFL